MSPWQWAALGVALWALAALQHFVLAPWQLRLQPDYAEETSFTALTRMRPSMNAPWEEARVVARRVDQTLVASGRHSIVQGSVHWTNDEGEPAFETASIYGVDRDTRANLPGFGDVDRHGQFLFPLHTARRNYALWDPQYLQVREAVFEGAEQLDGVEVLVFRFEVKGIDESDGYAHLADVPERYRALSDGKGRLWVEPVSGTIVRYEEEGTSYFYEAASHKRIGDIYVWSANFTPEAAAARLKAAKASRLNIRILEAYLPLALLCTGAVALAVALRQHLGHRRSPEGATRAAEGTDADGAPR